MKALIVSKDIIHVDAIYSWLMQSAPFRLVYTTADFIEARGILEENQIRIVVLSGTFLAREFVSSLAGQVAARTTASFVILIQEFSLLELASLVSKPVSAILHIQDAKACFLSGSAFAEGKGIYLSSKVNAEIGHIPGKLHPLHELTRAERVVASMLLQGRSNKEMASMLFRSQQTIKDHRKHIKGKLGIAGGKNALLSFLAPYTYWLVVGWG